MKTNVLHLALAIWMYSISNTLSQVPEIKIIEWPDAYGLEYALTITFSKVEILCKLPKDVGCSGSTARFELYDEETATILGSTPCIMSEDTRFKEGKALFSMLPNDTKLFGKLRCRYFAETTSNSVAEIPFVFCRENSKECIENTQRDNDADMKFCIMTKNGPQPCKKISDPSMCALEGTTYVSTSRFCPVDEVGMCKAITKNHSAAWFRIRGGECPKVNEPPVTYKEKPLRYGEPFLADPNHTAIRFRCRKDTFFANAKIESTSIDYGSIEFQKNFSNCLDEINFNLDKAIFSAKTYVYRVTLKLYKEPSFYANFEYRMVVFGTALNLSTYKDPSTDQETLSCKVTSLVYRYNFRITRWWTKKSTGPKRLGLEIFDQQHVPHWADLWEVNKHWLLSTNVSSVGQTDEYQCHALIEFKTCAPHRHFEKQIKSNIVPFYYKSADKLQSNGQVFWTTLLLVVANLLEPYIEAY